MKKKLLTLEMLMFLIVASIGVLILHSQATTPVIRTVASTDLECGGSAPINMTTAGLTRIVIGGIAPARVRICHISFSTTAPEDITIVSGNLTTTACDTSPLNITGVYKSVQSMALDFSPYSQLRSQSGQDICINQSAAQILGGVIQYALY